MQATVDYWNTFYGEENTAVPTSNPTAASSSILGNTAQHSHQVSQNNQVQVNLLQAIFQTFYCSLKLQLPMRDLKSLIFFQAQDHKNILHIILNLANHTQKHHWQDGTDQMEPGQQIRQVPPSM